MEPTTRHLTEQEKCRAALIEQQAQAILDAHVLFRGRAGRFEFTCHDDVLVVRGVVPSYYLKQVLQHVVKDIDGVRLIDNQVQVISADGAIGESNG